MSKVLYTPKDSGREDLPQVDKVGGKGYGLYWLMANRFPAPLTWVLTTTAFDLSLRLAGFATRVSKLAEALSDLPGDWAHIQRVMDDLEPVRSRLVHDLRALGRMEHIDAILAELPPGYAQWAVRSSATVEDDPHHSFAGLFDSLLSVPSGDLWDAVRRVWASNYSREALFYCAQNRTPMPAMAVILQPLEPIINWDRSGVAFSHSPVPNMPGVLIQAAYGAGPTVVDGYGGDLFSVQGDQVTSQAMTPEKIVVTGANGRLESQPSPAALSLDDDEALELAGLVRDVAAAWGSPVNVEFVWRAGKRPLLVQVRSVASAEH